jgi:hypothetical protein
MDAQANPVRRRGREAHSSDFPTQQLPDVDVSLNKALDRSVIVDAQDIGADKQLQNEYLEALAFNEDPITISLEPTQEKNPPKWIECWVQGKGAEVLTADGWQAWGYLPMGSLITTKRKYVEVLLGSKVTKVATQHDDGNVDSPRNWVRKVTTSNVHVTIHEDKSPKGGEWLRRIKARAV